MLKKAHQIPRRRPTQARARELVRALLEATAQVLVEDGYDRASTNRIAARAGVSVGSIYQYFGSKEQLVSALIDDFVESGERHISEAVVRLIDEPPERAIAAFVRGLVEFLDQRPELLRVLVQQTSELSAASKLYSVEKRLSPLCRAYLLRHHPRIDRARLDAVLFMGVNVISLISARIVLESPKQRRKLQHEDELVRMIVAYLGSLSEKDKTRAARQKRSNRR